MLKIASRSLLYVHIFSIFQIRFVVSLIVHFALSLRLHSIIRIDRRGRNDGIDTDNALGSETRTHLHVLISITFHWLSVSTANYRK